jgi:hypothetical protein
MTKTMGEMTPTERLAAARRAAKRVSTELQALAPALSEVLSKDEPKAAGR